MESTLRHPRNKRTLSRLRWNNVLTLMFVLVFVGVILFSLKSYVFQTYEIEYVEYYMQENDSLFNVVQELNTYAPWGWDAHSFVSLAVDKNNIVSVADIRAGEKILIPVAIPDN